MPFRMVKAEDVPVGGHFQLRGGNALYQRVATALPIDIKHRRVMGITADSEGQILNEIHILASDEVLLYF